VLVARLNECRRRGVDWTGAIAECALWEETFRRQVSRNIGSGSNAPAAPLSIKYPLRTEASTHHPIIRFFPSFLWILLSKTDPTSFALKRHLSAGEHTPYFLTSPYVHTMSLEGIAQHQNVFSRIAFPYTPLQHSTIRVQIVAQKPLFNFSSRKERKKKENYNN